ncbi:MAG: glycogen-binding domain-containing protein [Gemmatimonadota bacterium]
MNEMDSRLQAYLDGELQLEDLPAELRERAAGWDVLLDQFARSAPSGAPPGLADRVMEVVRSTGGSADRSPSWVAWMIRPRVIRVSPLAGLAAAAVLMLAFVQPWSGSAPSSSEESLAGRVYVQFLVEAEAAQSVHLAGDFSDWQPTISLDDSDGDGIWSGRVPLEPGVHEYMFVIDGSEWVPDPNASGSLDDGFGRQNSLLTVSSVSGT